MPRPNNKYKSQTNDYDSDDLTSEKPHKKKADRQNDLMCAMMANKLRFQQEKEAKKEAGCVFSDSDESLIDWDDVDKTGAAGNIKRWANYHKIEKEFYFEHEDVSKMTKTEVEKWRKENHDIQVAHLKKISSDKETDTVPDIEIMVSKHFRFYKSAFVKLESASEFLKVLLKTS